MNSNEKKVSVLIPCRNEVEAIGNCLDNVCNFEEPDGGFEVIVVDGMSDDGTREIILEKTRQYPNLILVDNPMKTIPYAMNLGIQKAKGDYIVRTDVRCIHPKTYLRDLIELSKQTQADNVGGVLEPVGNSIKVQYLWAEHFGIEGILSEKLTQYMEGVLNVSVY